MKQKPILLALLLCILGSFGCSQEPTMNEDEFADKTKMTSIASKAFGEKRQWSALTPEEKKPFLDFYKEEPKAQEAFDKIYKGLEYFSGGGGPSAGRPK